MKRIIKILSVGLLTFYFGLSTVVAQSPEKMNYQAVVRNSNDALITNQALGMQISILQGSTSGSSVYTETHTPTTNINGLVSLEIGTGVTTDDFSAIDWSAGPYFIKTETDPTGGTTYSITGTSQLMSVPYALYAKTSGSSTPGPQGPAGNDGNDGATGPAGPQGPQGPAGNDGNDGATGLKGDKGDTGTTGLKGDKGDKGDTGTTGLKGDKGDKGDTGTAGLKGDKGDKGDTGATGLKGDKGDKGDTGTAGLKGDKGDKGDTGATGLKGDKGDKGDTGATGLKGDKGDKGDTGAAGPAGGGLMVTLVSSDVTITNQDQLVRITGTRTVTLPLNPTTGRIIHLVSDDFNAIVDPNGNNIFHPGVGNYGTKTLNSITFGNNYATLIYDGTDWVVINI